VVRCPDEIEEAKVDIWTLELVAVPKNNNVVIAGYPE
jgi:hypothetical protein